jgi:hypothetical protein
MNVRDGDRLAAIAILEPSPNGGGDESESVTVDEDGAVIEALPTDAAEDLVEEIDLADEDEDVEADVDEDEDQEGEDEEGEDED